MINLEQTLNIAVFYQRSTSFLEKFFLQLFSALTFFIVFRSQVTEMNILPLVPGTYFLFLFFFLLFSCCFSSISFFLSFKLDDRKENGTKGNTRIKNFLNLKYLFFLITISYQFNINIFFPLTIDCFTLYGENSLENIWNFSEIFFLQSFLILVLIVFFTFPFSLSFWFSIDEKLLSFSEFWKVITFFSFVIAGIITPTLDPGIQSFLAFFSLFFYLMSIIFFQKRLNFKFLGFSTIS